LSNAREAAERYIAEGWRVVPVKLGEKNPTDPGWPDNHYDADEITENVGVILGPVSGGLADIDLDSYWSLYLAPYFLPETVTFGRSSKRASHWLYYCDGARSRQFTFQASEHAKAEGKAVELVEIRAQNASSDRCGHQSIFPGSIHKSGEAIEWDDGKEEITRIERGALVWAVTRLAVACIIADGWDEGSQRNNKCRAWAGGLLSAGWTAAEVRELFEAVFDVADVDDSQRSKDLGAIDRTILAFENGTAITGFGTLVSEGLVDAAVVRRVEHHCRTPDTLARELKLAGTVPGREIRERIIREAQETDRLGAVADEVAEALIERDAQSNAGDAQDTILGRIIDLTEPVRPLDYVCEELGLAPGKISAIAGYAGTSKGVLANLFGLCCATGKPFLGMRVKRRRVAILDFETGPLFETRLKRLARGIGVGPGELKQLQDENWLVALHATPPISDEYFEALDSALERDMVLIVDSYTSAVPGDQNDSEYARVAWSLGAVSTAKNVLVLAVMHEKKTGTAKRATDLEMISGHNAIAGTLQSAIALTRPTEDKSVIQMSCARAPEEWFKSFSFQWVDVLDPAAKDSPGGKAKGAKWGLAAKREGAENTEEKPSRFGAKKPPPISPRSLEQHRNAIAEEEQAVMAYMNLHYANSAKARRSYLLDGSADKKQNRRTAIKNLLQRGLLLGDFDATQEPTRTCLIWLPGPKADIGWTQAKAG